MNEQDENQKNVQENNQDKDVSQKVAENVNDTVNAVKDTANLATNLAAQNYAGAVKDAANLLNNKVARRHLMLNYFINYIMPILAVILAIVVLASFVFAIWKGVGQAVQDVINGVVETADGFLTGIADFFNPDDGTIDVSDVQVDTIVNAITDLGVDLNGLKIMGDIDYNNPDYEEAIKEASRRYIREFYEAQAMTETLNTKPNWVEEYILNGGKPYGTVYVYRTNWENSTLSATSSDNQLKYVKYEEMLEMAENGDKNIKKYFSRDENAQLVVAGWTETKINDQETGQVTVNLYHINYKEYVSQYTTSMNFFLYLAEISENPEFVSAVTDLVKRSKINITLMDTETTTVQEVTTSSIKHVKTPDGEVTTEPVKNVSKTTTIVTVPTVKVTYAQTWFCEQTIEYNKKEDPPITNTRVETHSDTPQIDVGENINWSTNRTTSTVTTITKKYYEEGIRGDVIDRLGEKGSPGLNFLGKVDEKTRFLGLLDDEFKIPNSTRYDIAGTNVVSGAEILFDLLQNDSYTQNLELVMRYALYKYTGKDYGVTELNLSVFGIQDMVNISTSVVGGNLEEKVWFTLRNAGYSEYAVAGVMGNIYAESGFDPELVEKANGIGFGLCQWSYERRANLEAYAASKGVPASDVDTQIEFLLAELTPGGGANGYARYEMMTKTYYGETRRPEDWVNATSASEAAKAFCYCFERPEKPNVEKRQNKAEEYYQIYKGRTMPTVISTGSRMTLQELFPEGIPTTAAQMKPYLVDVAVKYNDKNGKVGTKTVTVHKAIAQEVQDIFDEIQRSGFKAYSIGSYNWRTVSGSSKRSNHSYGLALDINPNENYWIKNGEVKSGSLWKPYENEYSMAPDGPVVTAFKARGWDWGGDWKSSKDYMHFSKNGG